jgi:CrcB protein
VIVLAIMVGGAFGALARYVVDIAVSTRFGRAFPYGTLVINVTGSALLGFLTGLVLHHGFAELPMAVLGPGFCGGYTTFSTYSLDTVQLAERGAAKAAAVNVAANLFLGVAAAALGLALASI